MEPQVQQNKSSIGSIIGTIIIIAIIILGGLYFWGKMIEEAKLNEELISEPVTTETTEVSEEAKIKNVGTGDDTDSIEKDLDDTDLDNLDAELDASLE